MTRILFFALLAAVAWIWFTRKKGKPDAEPLPPETPVVEHIVQCAYCGLRVPEGESLLVDGKHYLQRSTSGCRRRRTLKRWR
jgi:uncharacterized protein